MNCLLDTHVWLWSLTEPDRLSPGVRDVIESGEHQLGVSAISIWEAWMLNERGKIDLGDDPHVGIEWLLSEYPITEWPVTSSIAMRSRELVLPHQDPADRFLAGTAVEHQLVLLTRDQQLLDASAVRTMAA